ncbi:uncharacterized protein ISCGN_009781 [Ixodes scapularis]
MFSDSTVEAKVRTKCFDGLSCQSLRMKMRRTATTPCPERPSKISSSPDSSRSSSETTPWQLFKDTRLREAGAEVVYCLTRGAPKGPNLPRVRLNHQDALFHGHRKATHSQTWAGEPARLGVRGDATLQTPAFTGTQTALPKSSKEVQTEAPQQGSPSTSTTVLVEAETDDANLEPDEDPLGLLQHPKDDVEFHPDSSEDEETSETDTSPGTEQTGANKYIVFESCLKKLLKRCPDCFSMATEVSFRCIGSMVRATITCSAGHSSIWESQPRCHGKPEGNILMCSGILFSGGCPTKMLRLFDIMGVAHIHSSQFYEYQRCYLLPAVMDVWTAEQQDLVQSLGGRSLRLAGDGRSDSPGYSALYGTYSLLETTLNRIIHLELVKSTEVKSSCHMELEGLTRALLHLEELGLTVEVIVTDRHVQVSAYMKREHPLVQHRFDLWHVSKGIKKKIVALAKSPQHKALARWLDTITRHLYWCARTSDNHGDLILAKWTSITRHICDVHHHPNSLHPACLHGEVQDRLWIEEGTETFKKLESVVLSSHLLRDIPKLSSDEQTFSLEAFHGVLVHFASKSVGYCYEGLQARTYIAALHFNCNADRKTRIEEDGQDMCALKFSRGRKQWTVVPVKEDTKFGYIEKLLAGVFERITRYPTFKTAKASLPRLERATLGSTQAERPDLKSAVAAHRSRYQRQRIL